MIVLALHGQDILAIAVVLLIWAAASRWRTVRRRRQRGAAQGRD